jgi:O-antigen ligase
MRLAAADILVERLLRIGEWTIGLIALSAIALALSLSLISPTLGLLVPGAVFGLAAMIWVLSHPIWSVAAMIGAFVLVLRPQDGLAIGDLIFLAYYLAFLARWFTPRIMEWKRHVIRPEDVALLLFFAIVIASIPVSLVFGAQLSDLVAQLLALSVLSLFFPIRDVCTRYPHGHLVMTGALMAVVTFAALRNLAQYQEIVLSAQQAWQFTTARVWVNDSLMMTGSVMGMVMTLFARRMMHKVGFGLIFAASLVALVMTQSRGFWVAFLVGAVVIFLMVDRRRKVQVLVAGALSAVAVGAVAALWLSEFLPLIVAGLTDRFGSLGTATTADISLVNRFVESRAVFTKILLNPVVGYGIGVPFSFYDITWDATMTGTFIHSGYLSLWYRFGIFGLVFVLFFWATAAWNGLRTFRGSVNSLSLRACGLATAAVLIAYILPAQTSNPFVLIDSLFLFTCLSAIAGGVRIRAEREAQEVRAQ